MITSSFLCSGVPCTLQLSSAAILGSSSTAITLRACSSILVVSTPVPGPISRTVSTGWMFALLTMASAMAAFLRICWPILVLNLKMGALPAGRW